MPIECEVGAFVPVLLSIIKSLECNHTDIFIEIQFRLGLLENDFLFRLAIDVYFRPHNLLHGKLRCDPGSTRRRPTRAIVHRELETQSLRSDYCVFL